MESLQTNYYTQQDIYYTYQSNAAIQQQQDHYVGRHNSLEQTLEIQLEQANQRAAEREGAYHALSAVANRRVDDLQYELSVAQTTAKRYREWAATVVVATRQRIWEPLKVGCTRRDAKELYICSWMFPGPVGRKILSSPSKTLKCGYVQCSG